MSKTPKTTRLTANYEAAYSKVKDLGLSTKEFRLILDTFHYVLMKDMVDEGTIYQLPNSLGHIGIYKRETVGRGMFNYKLYAETGVKSYIKNRHSANMAANFIWVHGFPYKGVKKENRALFKWRPSRDFKRYLAQVIKTQNSIHIYNYLDEN